MKKTPIALIVEADIVRAQAARRPMLGEVRTRPLLAESHKTKAPLKESFKGKKGFGYVGEGRERVLVQYADYGNQLAASRKTCPRMEAGVYKVISTMEGIFFERSEIRTDGLLRFEDSRYNQVLSEVNRFWGLAERFKAMNLTHKRGVLLFGDPGQGKSCLLAQVQEDAVKQDTVVFIGSRSMRDTVVGLKQFKEVEADRKALVMMEDMDEICNYDEHSVLEMMDGGDQMDGVLVVGTTNYLSRLPPRILRSGRFDTKMEVKAPPLEGRLAYFGHKLAKVETEARIKEIAEQTDGFSFAQMREFIASVYVYDYPVEASIDRIRRNLTESAKGSAALTEVKDAAGFVIEFDGPKGTAYSGVGGVGTYADSPLTAKVYETQRKADMLLQRELAKPDSYWNNAHKLGYSNPRVKPVSIVVAESKKPAPYRSDEALIDALIKRGKLAESRGMAFISSWKTKVKRVYPEATFTRSSNMFELVAKVGAKTVGRYDEASGVFHIKDK